MTTTTLAPAAPSTLPILNDETRRVLATAKGIIASGWCQGSYTDGHDRYCIVGTLDGALAAHGLKTSDDAYIAAERALNAATQVADIVGWNDAPGRTQAEVIALIDKALGT